MNTPYPAAGIPPPVKRPGDLWLDEASDRSPRAFGNPLLYAAPSRSVTGEAAESRIRRSQRRNPHSIACPGLFSRQGVGGAAHAVHT